MLRAGKACRGSCHSPTISLPRCLITGLGLPSWHRGKESACRCRRPKKRRFDPRVRKILPRRKWQPSPVFLPGKFHEQRSLAGYNPWGHKESDMTEHTHTYLVLNTYAVTNISLLKKYIFGCIFIMPWGIFSCSLQALSCSTWDLVP